MKYPEIFFDDGAPRTRVRVPIRFDWRAIRYWQSRPLRTERPKLRGRYVNDQWVPS